MSAAPGPRILCALEDIPDNDAKGFAVEEEGRRRKILVVRRGERLWGYLNRCPHAGTPLDWVPDRFFSRTREHLICQTHGALFEVEDGFCIDGPCAGDSLTPVPVRLQDGMVLLDG